MIFSSKKNSFKTNLLAFSALVITLCTTTVPTQAQTRLSGPGVPQELLTNQSALISYYNSRAMKPLWVEVGGASQPRVDAISSILEDSWTHGLNPESFRVKEIRELSKSKDVADLYLLDMMITDSALRYAEEMAGMRGRKTAGQSTSYWRDPVEIGQILETLNKSEDPVSDIRSLEPGYALYQALREELKRLSALPAQDNKKITFKDKSLKPGETDANLPELRARLGLPETTVEPTVYDETAAVEVMKLQRQNGLDADGVIGPKTLALINVTTEDKLSQVVANMERLRWMYQTRPDRYIMVNIPSANLWAIDGGEVKLEMPVIVGKEARPTVSFMTKITGVRFNPNWTVPPTIKQKDFLPALMKDPYALEKKGIRFTQGGEILDPGSIDWSSMSPNSIHRINMVQNPGDENPLGKVRVIMDNPYDIYLHDTNNRGMFTRTERSLSSGCIRLSEPEKLADFLLEKNSGWDAAKTKKAIKSGSMRDVTIAESIPVYITYQTMWLDANGALVYGRDIYAQDKKLVNALRKSDSVHITKLNTAQGIML